MGHFYIGGDSLVKAVEEFQPDLLIIGPHRRRALIDEFVGTVAERVSRLVKCPVLMVISPPAGPYRHVLKTTDLSDTSRFALQRASKLMIAQSAKESLLHVFDAPVLRLGMSGAISKEDVDFHLQEEAEKAKQELARFASTLGEPSPPALLVQYGYAQPVYEILNAVGEHQADLLVQATHGRGTLSRMLLGSVTERIMQSSSVDVLVIPPTAQ